MDECTEFHFLGSGKGPGKTEATPSTPCRAHSPRAGQKRINTADNELLPRFMSYVLWVLRWGDQDKLREIRWGAQSGGTWVVFGNWKWWCWVPGRQWGSPALLTHRSFLMSTQFYLVCKMQSLTLDLGAKMKSLWFSFRCFTVFHIEEIGEGMKLSMSLFRKALFQELNETGKTSVPLWMFSEPDQALASHQASFSFLFLTSPGWGDAQASLI